MVIFGIFSFFKGRIHQKVMNQAVQLLKFCKLKRAPLNLTNSWPVGLIADVKGTFLKKKNAGIFSNRIKGIPLNSTQRAPDIPI